MAISRTFAVLSVVLLWQFIYSAVESRPLYPKKHTTSPSKHQHHSMGHKNAISHHQKPASIRELALGSQKASREILPFHFSPTEKQATKSHHRPTWGAITPSHLLGSGAGGFGAPVVETSAVAVAGAAAPKLVDDGLEVWGGPLVPFNQQKGSPFGDVSSGIPKTTGPASIGGGGIWGAYKTSGETDQGDEGFGGKSKAIHMIPGEPPRIVEESYADGDVGTVFSSESDDEDTGDSEDGWFMSPIPHPQAAQDEVDSESSSSSHAIADMWGFYRDRKSVGVAN